MKTAFFAFLSLSFATTTLPAQSPGDKRAVLPEHALVRIGSQRFQGAGHRMRFSPDGKMLAIAERSVRLFDPYSGDELTALPHLSKSVPASVNATPQLVIEMAFRADSAAMVSGDETGVVRFWDLANYKETRFPEVHAGLTSLCLSTDQRSAFTSGYDGMVRQWQLPDGKELASWAVPNKTALLALASAANHIMGVSKDGDLFYWDENGKETRRLQLGSILLGHNFDWALQKFPTSGSSSWPTYPRNVEFSADSKWLMQHNGQQVWNLESSAVSGRLPPVDTPVRMALSPDGAFAATSYDFKQEPLRLFGVRSGQELRQLPLDRGIRALTFSPDGQTLAYCTYEGFSLWQPATFAASGLAEQAIGRLSDWDIAPDGKQIVLLTGNKGVHLFDAETGKKQESIAVSSLNPALARFQPGGRLLLGFLNDGVYLYEKSSSGWQVANKVAAEKVQRVTGPAPLVPIGETGTTCIDAATLKSRGGLGTRNRYTDFVFSVDGRYVIAGVDLPPKTGAPVFPSNSQKELHVIGVADLAVVVRIKRPATGVNRWRLSFDNRLAAVGRNTVQIYEVHTGVERAAVTLPDTVTTFDFAPDSKSLLAGTMQGEIVVVGIDKSEELHRTGKAHNAVQQLRVTTQGKVVTVGEDQTIVVWSADVWKDRVKASSLKLLPEDLDLFYDLLLQASGDNVGPAIKSLIGGGDTTVDYLKTKFAAAKAAALQEIRAVEILEHIGTTAAQSTLAVWANAPASDLATEARQALERLRRLKTW